MRRESRLGWSIVDGLRTLIFPEICIMCQSANALICDSCFSIWNSPAHKLAFDVVPTYSVVSYNKQVSSVVLKAKEERNKTAQLLIANAISRSMRELIVCGDISRYLLKKTLLVPIPSSRQTIQRRGESFLHPIMNQVIRLTRENSKLLSSDLNWAELLTHSRKVRDQAGLTSSQRVVNLRGAFSVSHDVRLPVILVDDVVTTGATLRNAIYAFKERKMTVLGAITACASAHQLLIR